VSGKILRLKPAPCFNFILRLQTLWRNPNCAVVDEFVGRVAADNRINHFFAQTAADPKRMAMSERGLQRIG
jgi:hypothetical protein